MIEVVNPTTGKLLNKYEPDTPHTIASKITLLRQSDWRYSIFEYRASKLEAFGKLLEEKGEECAALLTKETGKPIRQARGEISGTLARLDFFLNEGQKYLAAETVHQDDEAGLVEKITYDPIGVVANVSAWNYPYFVGCNVLFPALLAGNRVAYKPSEYCVGTGLMIVNLLYQAGVPEDAVQVVIGDGAVGAQLVAADVDGVFFTGSVGTGEKIAMTVGPKIIPMQMELGGKDPAYVCDDVDVKKAAAAVADGAFYNAGQSCCAVERVYVHKKIYAGFIEEFVKTVQGFEVGDPEVEATYLGPLTRPEQLGVLEAQVADAISKGAKLKCGGKRHSRPGYFEPTVLVDCTHEMSIMREESFGPIIGLMAVSSDEEAVKMMDDTDYGLTAGVFTPNQDRAEGILRQLDSGSAYWNCSDRVSPHLPWTGRRNSGLGYTLSHLGIRAFTKARGWHLRRSL